MQVFCWSIPGKLDVAVLAKDIKVGALIRYDSGITKGYGLVLKTEIDSENITFTVRWSFEHICRPGPFNLQYDPEANQTCWKEIIC